MTANIIHLRILNWLVGNSPRAIEQRIIPDLNQVLMVILKFRRTECDTMKENAIETKIGKALLTVKASSFILN